MSKDGRSRSSDLNFFERLSFRITSSLENFFYFWGHSVGNHPWYFILGCLVITTISSIGLLRFTPENRPTSLWIPWNSEFLKDTDWLHENFPSPIRFHHAIISAPNVLEPHILKLLLGIHQRVREVKSNNDTYETLCFRLPVTKIPSQSSSNSKRRRKKRDFEDDDFFNEIESPNETSVESEFDPSVDLPLDLYCEYINELQEECWENNLAELWNFNQTLIESLTLNDILTTINSKTKSPIFGRYVNYTTELGGIVKNETSGDIVGASAILLRWFNKINQTALKEGVIANDLGTGEIVDPNNLEWETHLVQALLAYPMPQGTKMYIYIARSFGDISNQTIMGDVHMFAIGFSIVFMYVIFMLGKCNFVEQRPLLSLAGLGSVGLAIIFSYGLCSSFKLIYGPVHNVLPFLLLGIGIDDVFVIMESFKNLENINKLEVKSSKSIGERVGSALSHAGVSITVTSVTDFIAFVIGGTTVLPALQSFCVYAAFGVLATFIFQATFFTAFLALDERRIAAKRNAFLICIKHGDNYTQNSCSRKNYAHSFFGGIYSKILLSKPAKAFVFLLTAIITSFCIYGNFQLRQEFNPTWFLPTDSYLFQYLRALEEYFPGRGHEGIVMMGNISLNSNLPKIESFVNNLESSKSVYDLDAWYPSFKTYSNKNFKAGLPNNSLSEKEFSRLFSRFLYSPSGSRFRGRMRFNGNLTCGKPAPKALVTSFAFKFTRLNGPEAQIPAMHEVKNLIRNAEFEPKVGSRSFIWSIAFAAWETDEIITTELYRNMGLALICVLMSTLILITNLKTCLMVLLCVLLTLIDVLGGMHYWNLTIDTVSCIDLVIAIGLSVDYSAHVGYTFMTCVGSRNERARKSLQDIGPPVLNGGFSTFLAFVLLANSKSHVFMTFYKIFFLVVTFGLYHGLVFLPVLLSVLGPEPYRSAIEKNSLNNENNELELNAPLNSQFLSNNDTSEHETNNQSHHKLNGNNLRNSNN